MNILHSIGYGLMAFIVFIIMFSFSGGKEITDEVAKGASIIAGAIGVAVFLITLI